MDRFRTGSNSLRSVAQRFTAHLLRGKDGAVQQPTADLLQEIGEAVYGFLQLLPDYLAGPIRLSSLLGRLPFLFSKDLRTLYASLIWMSYFDKLGPDRTPTTATQNPRISQQPKVGQLASGVDAVAEILVIGSGPGGALTACHLAEAGKHVVLLEEGDWLARERLVPFSPAEVREGYRNAGLTVLFGRPKISYAEGRCVGGGSEVNSGLYHRTPPEILENWRKQFDIQQINETDLNEHFEANEKDLGVSLLGGTQPAISAKLELGARRLGWRSMEVPQTYADQKQSMSVTFIPRFLKAGGRLISQARVRTIRQERGIWRVECSNLSDHRPATYRAKSVFLAAGAIQSATVLRRSGIRRAVGESLAIHPTLKLVAEFNEPVNQKMETMPAHQVKEFSPRLSFGCSVSTPPFLALGLIDHPAKRAALEQEWHSLAIYYAMISGPSSGRIRCVPGYWDPWVTYRLTESDRLGLLDGAKKLCELLLAAGARNLYPSWGARESVRDSTDVDRVIAHGPSQLARLMTIHLMGTCPMGEDKARCAADSFGRVHDTRNLYLADASLLCGPLGVNPQGTIMAIARRNVFHFLENS